jgi:hypothetical protein
MIDLTDEQTRVLESQTERPPRFRNPGTQETFVLIRQDVFELMQKALAPYDRCWDDPTLDVYEQFRDRP